MSLFEEVRGDRLYSEGPSPTYPGTRDYILTDSRCLSASPNLRYSADNSLSHTRRSNHRAYLTIPQSQLSNQFRATKGHTGVQCRNCRVSSGQEDWWDLEKRDQKEYLNPNPDDDPKKKGKVH